jgi:microcystin-dependent protein
MAEPFLSEIRIMSFGFPPKGWALCNGQLLPINQNQALFSLLGTTYGGDGRVNFGLPNLQGNAPIHMGSGFTLGELGGEQAHTHILNANKGVGNVTSNANAVLAKAPANFYAPFGQPTAMNAASVTKAGGSQAHQNMQPFLTLSFCIALQGIFPSQT